MLSFTKLSYQLLRLCRHGMMLTGNHQMFGQRENEVGGKLNLRLRKRWVREQTWHITRLRVKEVKGLTAIDCCSLLTY